MPKNTVKPEAAEPYSETATSDPGDQNDLTAYSEQSSLGGPIFKIGTYGPMPCRLQLSSKILERSGLKANDRIELIAVGDGQILIKKIGEPALALPPKTTKSGMDRALDVLMAETRAFEAEMKAAREQRYSLPEETEGEDEAEDGAEPLDEVQRRQEEL